MTKLTTILDGLAFPEGPRWHDGALWFSDMHAHEVVRVTESGDGDKLPVWSYFATYARPDGTFVILH